MDMDAERGKEKRRDDISLMSKLHLYFAPKIWHTSCVNQHPQLFYKNLTTSLALRLRSGIFIQPRYAPDPTEIAMRLHHLLILALWLPLQAFAQGLHPQSSAATELLGLHDKVMRAHRDSNVELLLEDEASDYVVANRGEITRPTIQQRRQRLGSYLKASRFSEYKDLVEPVVFVSTDSTLGWVVVQVSARGTQLTDKGEAMPIDFVSAWIELYERRDGRWMRIGNISNFKP